MLFSGNLYAQEGAIPDKEFPSGLGDYYFGASFQAVEKTCIEQDVISKDYNTWAFSWSKDKKNGYCYNQYNCVKYSDEKNCRELYPDRNKVHFVFDKAKLWMIGFSIRKDTFESDKEKILSLGGKRKIEDGMENVFVSYFEDNRAVGMVLISGPEADGTYNFAMFNERN